MWVTTSLTVRRHTHTTTCTRMQDTEWEAHPDSRSLEHSLVLFAMAPRLTRLTLFSPNEEAVPLNEASRRLQLLQHLPHLKHLQAEAPAATADAFDSMLMVRLWIWLTLLAISGV